jgi:molybdate transport system substrate-binding protein
MTLKLNGSRTVKHGFGKGFLLGVLALFLSCSTANAAVACSPTTVTPTIVVAVASNMWEPAQALAGNYSTYVDNSTVIQICHDATGNLVDAINNGSSNYSLFLAANDTAPDEVFIYSTGSVSNYTTGIPVLWSTNASLFDVNSSGNFNGSINITALANRNDSVIIANQITAPYGLAAQEIMEFETFQWSNISTSGALKIVSNINAAYNNISANASTIGYVARSQVCYNGVNANYTYDGYPSTYNIPQAGVVLSYGNTTVATAFWNWILATSTAVNDAQYILQKTYCYGAPTPPPSQ